VPESQVHCTGVCTICNARYFSYRREGTSDRNMAVLML
jgi:copper oxidase (laccase) domain-containing protein